jgi:hypothetical protein
MRFSFSGFAKFLLALSIPGAMVGFFFYAQNQADTQVKEFEKNQKEHPDTDKMSVDNYQLKEVGDDNLVRWCLVAKQGTLMPVTKDAFLQNVKVDYFEDKKVKLTLSAPLGIANEVTHRIELHADPNAKASRVMCIGEDGKAKLDAAKVELKQKNTFVASGGVNIVWPGVAKVSGNQATGSLAKGADLKNIKIVGNTHALIGQQM